MWYNYDDHDRVISTHGVAGANILLYTNNTNAFQVIFDHMINMNYS